MSDIKRRKLNGAGTNTPVSAIAARRAKAQAATAIESSNDAPQSQSVIAGNGITAVIDHSGVGVESYIDRVSAASTPRINGSRTPLRLDDQVPPQINESRVVSPEPPVPRPSIVFSTFKPSSKNVKELKDGTLALKLEPGERLVILGQFELCVQRGQISLLGYTLQPSKLYRRVCAPSSHSLPVIRCASSDVNNAELRIRQCRNGLENLSSLSALFGSLWDEDSGPMGSEHSLLTPNNTQSTYRILFTSQDGPSRTYLQPLISPPEWNAALSRISDGAKESRPTILLCGPKSSGKSTFARILCNRLLSDSPTSQGVAILDLDPGQPEYSAPGQISLLHIQEPNFGPPFSHPATTGKNTTVRSHSVGAVTPSQDSSLYMACALHLYAHYKALLQKYPKTPLVINTSGWVLGTGLEILSELIKKIRPTEVVYMSLDGPLEVVENLKEINRAVLVSTLPSQSSEYSTRTSAHLRTMQNLSYFHLEPSGKDGLRWNDTSLTSLPPWQVGYSGKESGILGVLCYGESPPPNLLAEAINGSIMSVVVIDDMLALPTMGTNIDVDNGDSTRAEIYHAHDNDLHILDDSTFHPTSLTEPLIISTPEGVPYFNPVNSIALDPQYSHSIGLALVRGIDTKRKCLQLLSPISKNIIDTVFEEGKKIVLVSGKLDTPGWAYTEALVKSDMLRKNARRGIQGSQEDDDGDGEGDGEEELAGQAVVTQTLILEDVLGKEFDDIPWVSKITGSQGRGVGSRVWRVRRDLGRNEGGE